VFSVTVVALLAGGGILLPDATPAVGGTVQNAQGVALATRVNDAYKRVPATIVKVSGPTTGIFTEILKDGVVAAEQYEDANSSGTTMLVARRGSPTYAKEPGTTCWRALAKSDQQTLDDIGSPVIGFLASLKGAAVAAPRSTPSGWTLALSQGGVHVTLSINKAMLIQQAIATKAGQRAAEQFQNLTRTPNLFVPEPHC
jgi:hypothetical protein